MNILITGATGLIGSALVSYLKTDAHRIFRIGRSLQNKRNDICLDLSTEWNLTLPDVNVIIHCAAQTNNYDAFREPLYDLNTNIGGLVKIIENYRKQKLLPFIIFIGNATQIGMTTSIGDGEYKKCDNPITFYDLSKDTAENYLMMYVYHKIVSGCSLRLCNVYGAKSEIQTHGRGILDKMMQKALNRESLTVYGDGSYLRDYVHIEDVVRAIDHAIEYREQLNGRTFVIGSGIGNSIAEAFNLVAEVAAETTGCRVDVNCVPPPNDLSEIEFRSYVADIDDFTKLTGWKPKLVLKQGLRYSYSAV